VRREIKKELDRQGLWSSLQQDTGLLFNPAKTGKHEAEPPRKTLDWMATCTHVITAPAYLGMLLQPLHIFRYLACIKRIRGAGFTGG
jgi:hypothetical protein